MSAPYWGKLPPPTIVRGNSISREKDSIDRDMAVSERRNDLMVEIAPKVERLSAQLPSSSYRRQYRDSTQTEAPTVSTQSPFASPTDSSFRGGLAPRPPSFPYDPQTSNANDDYLEKRRRRGSRNREQSYEEKPPPAAPDAPRPPPPVSYKQPYSSGPPSRTRSGRRSEGPISSSQGVADEYYARRGSRSNGKAVARSDELEWDPTVPERIDTLHRQKRQGSLSAEGGSQQRREWAPDRSPLQRLELTLDSITKEEKRSRVEEAEQLAKAGTNGEKPKQNSVRFRNRPIAKSLEGGSRQEPEAFLDPVPVADSSPRQEQLIRRRRALERQRPVEVAPPVSKTSVEPSDYQCEAESREDIPRQENASALRGQSVRDRSYIPVAVGGAAGAAPERSTSNRLQKEKPGDPWLHLRIEAENKCSNSTSQRPSVTAEQATGPSKEPNSQSVSQITVDRELPPHAVDSNRELEFDSDEEDMGSKPARRLSKIERLAGQRLPADTLKSQSSNSQATETVKVNGKKYGLPFTRSTSNAGNRAYGHQEESTSQHLLVGNLHQKQENVSEQGVYTPARRLDEWKKGGVAQLSGPLLNLDLKEQIELDKDKAWWEAGHTNKRRRSTSTKQRRAEAYDGEYDDNNGMDFQLSTSNLNSNVECEGCAIEAKSPGKLTKVLTLLLVVPTHLSISGSSPHLSLAHTTSSSSALKEHSLIFKSRSIRERPIIAPTRFKPPLFMKAGPSLRYCGLRREPAPPRAVRALTGVKHEREIWRGSIMIVTQDEHSSYELAPTLRLFLQPMDLIPPPPAQVDGEELATEYIDPLAGLPKIGRDGRTLYIRPVENLEEGRDLSKLESDEGLFETQRSNFDGAAERKCAKPHYDGEKAGKYKEVRGFRLHAEHGVTFWRFNLEIELREKQQRIAYRINRGPATGFWVPGRGQAMNIMFHSCNGFSYSTDPHPYNGPDPMWRDVLNNHQTQPFHVMLGGGDQIYNDAIMQETRLFKAWTQIKDPRHKEKVPFTSEMQDEIELFYLNRYCTWFSQGLFGPAISQIPMINIFDDHDIIDGYGSYPDDYMRSPVMSGLGAIAFKYYLLFQHQSSIDEGEETEPQWILGEEPGPYMNEFSRSICTKLGRSISFLGLDCRTERMNDEIVSAETYHKVFDRLEREIIKGETQHLIVLLGVPVAYPRMVWLENILTSRAMDPIKALSKAGLLGKNLLNHLDGGVEILDDLDDHWTAKHHKEERNWFIQELQDLAAEKSVRVTILGGDVHLAAIGQFYSNPKHGVPKHRDHRYMPNVISSAIVNAPPPDTLADVLNKRNKIHHLDADTDENMIPIFTHDVTGKARNNKCLLNRRNWCSIKVYDPELSPPPTPQTDGSATPPPPRRGLLRRLSSKRERSPIFQPDSRAPPLSSPGFFNRNPSNTRRGSMDSYRQEDSAPPLSNPGFFRRRPSTTRRGSVDSQRPSILTRTLSLGRSGSLFRRNSGRKPDSGGINGYGADSDSDDSGYDGAPGRVGLRGGAGSSEDGYFPQMGPPYGTEPEHRIENASTSIAGERPQQGFHKRQFHRTPTGLSEKQRKMGGGQKIDLEGGLDICLNVEVNHKDPAGITIPYRLLVPALWYEEDLEDEAAQMVKGGLDRWLSFAKRKKQGN
ncbi:hypothetical protein BJ875DRAFT_378390 [Amylocarpus encephaloides]|uniref:PhoD-like phosphatase domain-containing protein n=1 Tax=Amylocarpus encephaloides TaxID=45428 RepID=A0A9P7YGX1_9HELO|nr:hypothetical protein BJ875DRAFT_378390 [Amylocarpus encephaloides]